MTTSTVAIVRCDSYDENNVEQALRRGLDLVGGLEQFVRPGEEILLKPNVLAGDTPKRATTTHPVVVKMLGRMVKEITGNVTLGDSPAFGPARPQLRRSGFLKVSKEEGLTIADFDHGQYIAFPDSPYIKKFKIANGVSRANGIINIAKMKTHQLSRLTGAVKNTFGCIPGVIKTEYHFRTPNAYDFCKMLVALNLCVRPRLYILDSIIAMEGNGPRGGDPVPMNALILSSDPVAVDATAARMIDLHPEYVATSKPGQEWGLGVYQSEQIQLLGDALEDFINKDFNIERKPVSAVTRSGKVSFIKNWISPRPVIDDNNCIKCGQCVQTCPAQPKALYWPDNNTNRIPAFNYSRCIRCFCCQEICPERAISVKTPWLGRIISGR